MVIPICKAAAEVLDEITFGLGTGDVRKVDGSDCENASVWVGRLVDCEHGMAFSVGRYVVQSNGDVEADPEMTFIRAIDGDWHPLTYRCGETHRRALTCTDAGVLRPVVGVHLRVLRMAHVWMRRIRVMLRAREGVGAK